MALLFLLFSDLRGQLGHSSQLRVARMIRRGGSSVHHDAEIERFYTSRAWRKSRETYLNSVGRLCENCLSKGLIVPAEHVHHKKPITPEDLGNTAITLDHDNLMALCEECHREMHTTKRWRCDELGRVRL